MNLKRLIAVVALCAGLAGVGSPCAQELQRIAAIVNDEVISVYDLEARMRLIVATSGLPDGPDTYRRLAPDVLRSLVDERLQLQEAKRRNVAVTDKEVEEAIRAIEQQNRMPPGELDRYLSQNTIPRDTLDQQLRASLAWSKLVSQRLRPRITVGNDEVEEILERLRERQGQPEYRIAEILFTVDSPQNEDATARTARRLVDDLRGGARFEVMARQFSQSATAATGGDVGWVSQAELPEAVRATIDRLGINEIAGPFRTQSGYQIIQLAARRIAGGGDARNAQVTLRQVFLPAAGDARAAADRLRAVRSRLTRCDDVPAVVRELNSPRAPELGTFRVAELSAEVRGAVANLEIGRPSEPIAVGDGVAILMVCGRDAAGGRAPDREEVSNQLIRQRLDLAARRYMRDLRLASVVDVRS